MSTVIIWKKIHLKIYDYNNLVIIRIVIIIIIITTK